MKRSSIASPMTSTCADANPATSCRARSAASGGSSTVVRVIGRSDGRKRQRDEHQEHHQELGIAEVVLEEAGGDHGSNGRQRRRGQDAIPSTAERARDAQYERANEPEPD